MALVNHLQHTQLQVDAKHMKVAATYSIVKDENGQRYLQIDTYGSEARKLTGKKSQSIRLAPEAIAELKTILQQHF